MIGIIGAMPIETEILESCMENRHCETIAGITFHTGTIEGVECAATYCSPGKVNAAACTQAMILRLQPSLIVNTGVAGGIGGGVRIGDLVVASAVVQHDVDTTAVGDAIGLISGLNLVEIPTDTFISQKIIRCAAGIYPGKIHTGIIATGDQFIANTAKKKWIADTFGALACEMEAGSIGHVCRLNGVPFAAIRAISDDGSDGAGVNYSRFVEDSAHKSAKLLCQILPQIVGKI